MDPRASRADLDVRENQGMVACPALQVGFFIYFFTYFFLLYFYFMIFILYFVFYNFYIIFYIFFILYFVFLYIFFNLFCSKLAESGGHSCKLYIFVDLINYKVTID